MEHIVGIGGYAVSGSPEDVIKTFALSTCVGLVYYSMGRRCMGMAHIQLPDARNGGAKDLPSRFADVAPGFLLSEMIKKLGVSRREILVSLYGGIDPRSEQDCFRIGEKNLEVVKGVLRQMGLRYSAVDTGGQVSRTLIASVANGVVEVIRRPMQISL
ncbi:MAG: chemotaxis protein CheD [Oscillospiraceae bacterium]|jgi:chemotaxis protein CheD|nr:chemotaxis protein CheD [Oscillospiraceae bacterium]